MASGEASKQLPKRRGAGATLVTIYLVDLPKLAETLAESIDLVYGYPLGSQLRKRCVRTTSAYSGRGSHELRAASSLDLKGIRNGHDYRIQ
jgi:hypothetical protein